MELSQALKVFGITESLEAGQLKPLYRKLARANHPDHGGSTKAMQEVNEAYEVLLKVGAVRIASSNSWAERKARDAEHKEMAQAAMASIIAGLDMDAIKERIELVFGKTGTLSNNAFADAYQASHNIVWRSEDKQSAFRLNVYITVASLLGARNALGSTEAPDLPVMTSVIMVNEGRDIKLTRSRYSIAQPSAILFNMDELLPIKKTQNAMAKAAIREPKRIDTDHFLKHCAGFKYTSKDSYQIRDGKTILQAVRMKAFGQAGVSLTLFENSRYQRSIGLFTEESNVFTREVRQAIVKLQEATAEQWPELMDDIQAIHGKQTQSAA